MITRTLEEKLRAMARSFPIVTLTGPRQSGKSTLLRHTFPDYAYVSLEDPDVRLFASEDPRGFIATYPRKVVIDEAQHVPALFSYLQTHTDERGEAGMYILAGSHNFLLMQSISQSLAGRTAILKLLPLSHAELRDASLLTPDVDAEIFMGGYPRLYASHIAPTDFYPAYIQTYVERDVRQLKQIGDLSRFVRFIKLCAGRIGQLVNLSSLANECSIAVSTVSAWLSVLEAGYICYLLQPDYRNYAKRLVKSPKLYFYDTGLACSLLGIQTAAQVSTHYLRGGLFENMVINEFAKQALHCGQMPDLTFWRSSNGIEVDLIRHTADGQYGYEIKSSSTFSPDFFKGLRSWAALAEETTDHCSVVYTGDTCFNTSQGSVRTWDDLL